MCLAITVLTVAVFAVTMTRRAESQVIRQTDAAEQGPASAKTSGAKTRSPFKDVRFMFFIFMLLPVRTLFAHQWLTMPEYVLRAYPQSIAWGAP